MIELLGGGVIGTLLGGVFRLAPEVLKLLNAKSERSHELAMFDRQCQLEMQRGSQKLQEIGAHHQAAIDSGVLDAFKSAIEQQTDMTKAAGKWVASLSASVRPVVTYALISVYLGMQIGLATSADSVEVAFQLVMTPDFVALVSGILNYYFLNRTIERRGL
jgi:hypothetical protein